MAESLTGRFSRLMDGVRGRSQARERSLETLGEDEFKEETISAKEPRREIQNCSSCLTYNIVKISLYLCYACEVFLCDKCFQNHDQSHHFVKRKSRKSKRERLAERLVMDLRSERKKEEIMEGEKVEVYNKVNVKHELDKEDCRITGLCGLQDKGWVVLDSDNYCIKIFSSVTNTLLRYVRFGSKPRDVTEIKQKSTDPNSASGSKSGISGAARDEQDKQCLLVVTFSGIKQICFIDVNKTPAIKTKSIQMEKYCRLIDFSEDKIFTLCREDVGFGSRNSVDILSVEGNPLKVIQLDFWAYDLAVYKDRIYLTGDIQDKVFCINMEDGKTISQLDIEEGSWLRGICVDRSDNVYICVRYNNKLYRLSPDLREYEPLSLDTEYIERPGSICFTDDKLFVGHYSGSSLQNFVTVVQIT